MKQFSIFNNVENFINNHRFLDFAYNGVREMKAVFLVCVVKAVQDSVWLPLLSEPD